MTDSESWREIEARFRELQTSGSSLCAHWTSTAWNDAGEQWYLSGSRDKRLHTHFNWTAESAALRLGHSGGPSAVFFWLDLLRRDSPNFRQDVKGATHLPDGAETRSEGGTIHRVCEASADYCLKLENESTIKSLASGWEKSIHAYPKRTREVIVENRESDPGNDLSDDEAATFHLEQATARLKASVAKQFLNDLLDPPQHNGWMLRVPKA